MPFLDSIDKKYHPYIYGGLLLLLLLIIFSLISSSEKSKVSKSEIIFPALVLTKAEYCSYCKQFKPTWDKLKQSSIKTQNGVNINFIEVDSNDKQMLSKFPEVEGYPTIRYHYSFDSFKIYEGDRSFEDLVLFIKTSDSQKEEFFNKPEVVKAPDSTSKVMLPATVPGGGPAKGPSLIPNKASFNMLSDKEYVSPSDISPPPMHKRKCRKETKCDFVDYTKVPSTVGAGINPQSQLFYNGGFLSTNLTDRAYPQAKRGGLYIVEHW